MSSSRRRRGASLLVAAATLLSIGSRAHGVTITIDLLDLQGRYTAATPERSALAVPSPSADLRVFTLRFDLEGRSLCPAGPCAPAASFRVTTPLGSLDVGPFTDVLDESLFLTPFRPIFLPAGGGLEFGIALGRFPPPPGPLIPVPSAPFELTRATLRVGGTVLSTPEPAAAPLLVLLAATYVCGQRDSRGRGTRVRQPDDARPC